jgi:serine phosphatase RsbU (regulator of sigma subunit)/pSer/pThr/pTyr-binding forkhead associated (FHA) protein
MAFLERKNGHLERFELIGEKYVLGRHPDCDIIVDVGAVSRHHARVSREGNRYFIEDMRSRNGTFVNGLCVSGRYALSSGDEIRVCDVTFTFHDDGPPNPTGLSLTVIIDDEPESTHSTVTSRIDVASDDSHVVRFSASTEAKLQAILEITRSLGRSLSLDQVLPQVLNSLFKIFLQADRGFIVLQNEKGELIPRWTKLRHETGGQTIRISRTIVNQVIQSRQAVLSADASSDERFDMSQSIAEFRIRSLICAPLIDADGNVLGVIQVDTDDQRKRFRPEDLEVLTSVAVQAAVAIDNAQLHENVLKQSQLERELKLAREVQTSFLPKRRPEIKAYEFFDHYRPANEVGGDYFDYIGLPDGRLGIVVADVAGHGIAAALMMSKLSALVRLSLVSQPSPAEAVKTLNDQLTESEFDGRFITLLLAILDPAHHHLTYVIAGHSPPLHKRSSGSFVDVDDQTIGYPLLIDEQPTYRESSVAIQPGDILVFYTDGLSEAMNDFGEQYGVARIQASMTAKSAAVVGSRIIRDVDRFVNGGFIRDDMCLVCVSRSK